MPVLTHLDESGEAPRMVDIAGKTITERHAHARACLRFPPDVAAALRDAAFMTQKGAVLTIAQIAGVMGVKATSTLIPLCHPLQLTGCMVDITIDGDDAIIDCHVRCTGRTGVEMEALTGASVAALTIYDMCKALTHDMVIREVRLVGKRGGKRDFGDTMPVIAVP
ncbi:cyclic pyranopterin monophosphate synthase MoaC [Gluconacetobacter tumulisoli]|uniref:Cyclic pyranopterin monophosphate synthase MoaC n=1 Tax=Gluconacetobacter tumulisoli TaxID=1286189 RepID=A0A7W4PL79_9PROT|nr:cyclic pyranopterin monophosphate synthase MoaC [Gluconacetobacter tumulisoli]